MRKINTQDIVKYLKENANKNITISKALKPYAEKHQWLLTSLFVRLNHDLTVEEYEELKMLFKPTTRFKERYIYVREVNNYFDGDKFRHRHLNNRIDIDNSSCVSPKITSLKAEGKYFLVQKEANIFRIVKKDSRELYDSNEAKEMVKELCQMTNITK